MKRRKKGYNVGKSNKKAMAAVWIFAVIPAITSKNCFIAEQ
jgi:hypothetical protein